MRSRINIIAVAIVLAIISFAYARYDYSNRHSVAIGNTRFGVSHDLVGDWMKDEMLFAVIVPVGLIAVGLVLAVKK
jgi:hypothetical protein